MTAKTTTTTAATNRYTRLVPGTPIYLKVSEVSQEGVLQPQPPRRVPHSLGQLHPGRFVPRDGRAPPQPPHLLKQLKRVHRPTPALFQPISRKGGREGGRGSA